MKKIGLFLFIAAFILMALIPFAGMLIFGPAGAAANEILAFPPSCTEEDGSFNKAVLNDASDYLADHFFLRQELITVDAKLEAGLLGESATDDVVLGKDGWLYYATTLDDYRGQNLMTERELWAAARTLRLMQDYAADKTILCGHWHSSYGHSRYEHKGSEFGLDADFSPYYGPGVIALDACTAFSRKINILTLED